MAIHVLKEYLQEYSGNILILAGIILLVVGLLFVNIFGSIVSVYTLFFGIICVAYGLFARIGLFYLKLRSLNGLGTVLICIAIAFLALSIALMEFLSVKGVYLSPIYYRGIFLGETESISLYRPFAWLSISSLWVCFATLVVGLIIKVYCYFR